ncbi:hypothetical protein GE115_05630 [Agromyces sp. CFH 90414]|uniref:Histidine phosphatase family protein n=1 Tax=Agromyces agglutinans TaxID=2662258 RepID=A0A6I2FBP6_9MICO|nr:histidine phosphatase family protein [Agromyces agglutinans]MRG59353.1 hypothetical protein [Agromyces agglutinans]
MKTLYLVRHAKSDWDDPALDDHERPLNERGRRDAPAMGRRLAERGAAPALIVTSTAIRARTTADALAAELGIPDDRFLVEPRLYAASGRSILAIAADLPRSVDSAMLVGHNPGMSDALVELIGGSGDGGEAGDAGDLPTCAVAECTVDVDDWSELIEGSGRLVRLDTPRRGE